MELLAQRQKENIDRLGCEMQVFTQRFF